MDIAFEHDPVAVVHGLMNQRANVFLLRSGQSGQE